MYELPGAIRGCLFDLDGVLTRTADLHARAWKQLFDAFLAERGRRTGAALAPFDLASDYDRFVDGRPREDGARAFLASRGIALAEGSASDPPDADTIWRLAADKDELFERLLRERGVATYAHAIEFVRAVRAAQRRTAVVSSSRHCREVVERAGIADLFDARVDGEVAAAQHLHGKPAPDTYQAAARLLGLTAGACAVFEDAIAGVQAGHAGGFGFVVGIDRRGEATALRRGGADVVITSFAELVVPS